jgi:tetratricopeptide (TPR) repeat protein
MLKEKLLDEIEYIYNIGDFERLIGKCDELLKIDEDNPAALNYRAIALYYLERYDESLKLLDYNLKLHPTNPYVLNNRALVFIALEDYQKALKCCEEGLKYMDFDWLQKNKIEALIHLGRRDEAYEFYKSVDIPFYTFEEALENCGIIQKDGIFERMEVLLGERNFEEVLKICNEHEESERILEFKIVSLHCLGRYDEELECVNRAIEKYPNNYEFHFLRARISRNLDGAIESYERAFELLQSTSNYRLKVKEYIKCLKIKAHELIASSEYEEAIGTCEKIMKYETN